MFLVPGPNSALAFNPKAIDLYEAWVQGFFKWMLVLIYITASQPLHEPEILFTAWCNMSQQ